MAMRQWKIGERRRGGPGGFVCLQPYSKGDDVLRDSVCNFFTSKSSARPMWLCYDIFKRHLVSFEFSRRWKKKKKNNPAFFTYVSLAFARETLFLFIILIHNSTSGSTGESFLRINILTLPLSLLLTVQLPSPWLIIQERDTLFTDKISLSLSHRSLTISRLAAQT